MHVFRPFEELRCAFLDCHLEFEKSGNTYSVFLVNADHVRCTIDIVATDYRRYIQREFGSRSPMYHVVDAVSRFRSRPKREFVSDLIRRFAHAFPVTWITTECTPDLARFLEQYDRVTRPHAMSHTVESAFGTYVLDRANAL